MIRLLAVLTFAAMYVAMPASAQEVESKFYFRMKPAVIESGPSTGQPGDGEEEQEGESDEVPPSWTSLEILPEGMVGYAWESVLKATDASGGVEYAFVGEAPGWLSLDAATGRLSGTPGSVGTYAFAVRASDPSGNHADRTFSLTVEVPSFLFSAITTKNAHSCSLSAGGEAYCWGWNVEGQLGINSTTTSVGTPVKVSGTHYFTTISVGVSHTCAVKANGQLWCWGEGEHGRLGAGNQNDRRVPYQSDGSNFVDVSAGSQHTCGLTLDGKAWCWGNPADGRLGNNATSGNYRSPVQVQGGHQFISVQTGWDHACGLKQNGEAWCWGHGGSGRLGHGATTSSPVPVPVIGGHSFVQITAGGNFSCGLEANGQIWCWGHNSFGQLGNGTNVATGAGAPVPVAGGHVFQKLGSAGSDTACAIKANGEAWCWGAGKRHQLGHGVVEDSNVPVKVSGDYVFASISPGSAHSCGFTTSGLAYCWGEGGSGRIGDGKGGHAPVPSRVKLPSS